MKAGKTLIELATEIQRQTEAKRDFIAPAPKLGMVLEEQSSTLDNPQPSVVPMLSMANGKPDAYRFPITDTAHDQVASRLEIPKSYYERMRSEEPKLLASNVNTWLQKSDKKFMVRTLDGRARALLSDRYRPLDNFDLAEAVLPKLLNTGGIRMESCELTERRLYLKAVTDRLTFEVKKGDVVQAGIIISNSEIGMGSVSVEPLLFRLVCLNGAIVNDLAQKRRHVGKSNFVSFEGAEEFFRDETRMADDRAFWMKVNDVVGAMLTQARFEQIVNRWTEATTQKITRDPVEVVEVTAKRFGLQDSERSSVLTHLIQGADLSAYGLMNAITRAAQDVDSYDRSTELERVGPMVLELPRADWRVLAEVA